MFGIQGRQDAAIGVIVVIVVNNNADNNKAKHQARHAENRGQGSVGRYGQSSFSCGCRLEVSKELAEMAIIAL